jgi:hypothetical protein
MAKALRVESRSAKNSNSCAHFLALRGEPVAQAVEVAVDLGVIQPGRIAPDFEHDRFADATFRRRRKLGLGRFTEVGQAFGHCKRGRREDAETKDQRAGKRMQFHTAMIAAPQKRVVTGYFMNPPRKPATKPRAAPLTHFDGAGQAHMVDVGAKAETTRLARAQGHIRMAPATFDLIKGGSAKKGDVLGIARIAAIQASKRTSDLIPAVPSAGADARRRRVRRSMKSAIA